MANLRLVVCSHYLTEARAAIRAEGYQDIQAAAYRDMCSHPSRALDEPAVLVVEEKSAGDTLILGLCYLVPGQDLPPGITVQEVQQEETCFALFAPAELVRHHVAAGGHLLTPGWLSGWVARLKAWGFDQATARDFFHESTARLVLLDTGVLPGAELLLGEMAAYLDLPAEVIPVGLGHFRLHMKAAVLRWRMEQADRAARKKLDQTQHRVASHAMALDLLASLARTMSEEEAIQAILELLTILFGASKVLCVPLDEQMSSSPMASDGSPVDPGSVKILAELMARQQSYAHTAAGFCLRVRYQERDLALLAVEGLKFRQHMEAYINLALSVSSLLGMVITNARTETLRREANRNLKDKSAELERSNEELSHFAYAVSHDLQEPLRTITGFINLLAQRYGEQLDERADTYIEYTVDGAARMKRLIEDLLSYSRVSTHAKEPTSVDLNETLQGVKGNLTAALRESGASLTSDELPRVLADNSQVLQLLQNLVGNALKFRGEARPEVHVSAARKGDAIQVSVRDNGIGMEMGMAHRIFKIFQRLHHRREYEGTGIGLAVCKRIVERHGGQIWVQASPGEGATFHFTLPPG